MLSLSTYISLGVGIVSYHIFRLTNKNYQLKEVEQMATTGKMIEQSLSKLMQISAGFSTWYENATPKEQEMAHAIHNAILVDAFASQGTKKRLARMDKGLFKEDQPPKE